MTQTQTDPQWICRMLEKMAARERLTITDAARMLRKSEAETAAIFHDGSLITAEDCLNLASALNCTLCEFFNRYDPDKI